MVWKLTAAAGVFLAAVFYTADRGERAELLRCYNAHRTDGIAAIVDRYGPAVGGCEIRTTADMRALAAAFVTVESFATPVFSRWARSAIMRLGSTLEIAPDISFGPGRIRLSTARTALLAIDGGHSGHFALPSNREIVQQMLTACGSTRIAVAILKRMAEKDRYDRQAIDLEFVKVAARKYNGQVLTTDDVAAKLSAEIYFELVYDAFQYFRFAALSSRTAAVGAAAPLK